MLNTKLIKQVFIILTLSYVFLLFVGCATSETALNQDDIRYADTKALIEDKKKSSSNSVSMDVFYTTNGVIRIEVEALLGYQLGSLLMNKNQIQYILYPQKTFVQGPFAGRTLKPLFKTEIDPRWIEAAILDTDLTTLGFICLQKNPELKVCQSELAEVSVETKKSPLKKIIIENDEMKFIWVFKSIQKHKKSYNETFVLSKPEEYRLITIK